MPSTVQTTHSLNAKRFAGKPIKMPSYPFDEIPKAKRDLRDSTIELVEDRQHFVDAMGELVLLCNQAIKRAGNRTKKKNSKPLSLEYMADRLDVDDPAWGYIVRDEATRAIQGFITCTTFTNWQKSFRWDSLHDSAVAYDDETLARQTNDGVRKFDHDGELAAALQATVRCGDVWNEGIVYPRIAEIGLLGGLGCGKAMLSLVIEKLEAMKPSAKRNYDFVALQATENSIPFYESLGFVRVGCVIEDERFEEKQVAKRKAETSETETEESSSSAKAPSIGDSTSSDEGGMRKPPPPQPESEIVTSPVEQHVVDKTGQTPNDIAKKLGIDVWDIIFLNHYIYKDINPRSRLMKETLLYLPSQDMMSVAQTKASAPDEINKKFPSWYIASENDTPKMISKKFGLRTKELVDANIERLPDLQGMSRLKEGTRVKVSHFDVHDDRFVPYCHWTFPDDDFELGEPSYMMVKRLQRHVKPRTNSFESRLAAKVRTYKSPPDSLYVNLNAKESKSDKVPTPPQKPKRPLNAYMKFTSDVREEVGASMKGASSSKIVRAIATRWQSLDDGQRQKYQVAAEKARELYRGEVDSYKKELAIFSKKFPNLSGNIESDKSTLFNKVVRLKEHSSTVPFSNYIYYYVLTYIPDLQWCHLAPMRQVGKWGSDKPKCEGRPIWMLVDESLGVEVDISALLCEAIASRAMRHTVDADREQWDIVESGAGEGSDQAEPLSPDHQLQSSHQSERPATKPLGGALKVRKRKGGNALIAEKRARGGQRELPRRGVAPVSYLEEDSSLTATPTKSNSKKKSVLPNTKRSQSGRLTSATEQTNLFKRERRQPPKSNVQTSHSPVKKLHGSPVKPTRIPLQTRGEDHQHSRCGHPSKNKIVTPPLLQKKNEEETKSAKEGSLSTEGPRLQRRKSSGRVRKAPDHYEPGPSNEIKKGVRRHPEKIRLSPFKGSTGGRSVERLTLHSVRDDGISKPEPQQESLPILSSRRIRKAPDLYKAGPSDAIKRGVRRHPEKVRLSPFKSYSSARSAEKLRPLLDDEHPQSELKQNPLSGVEPDKVGQKAKKPKRKRSTEQLNDASDRVNKRLKRDISGRRPWTGSPRLLPRRKSHLHRCSEQKPGTKLDPSSPLLLRRAT